MMRFRKGTMYALKLWKGVPGLGSTQSPKGGSQIAGTEG